MAEVLQWINAALCVTSAVLWVIVYRKVRRTCLDAASEIERRRAAGDALLAALQAETVNGGLAVCDGTNEAMETWEADRG